MLEVTNGFLFTYFLALCFISALVPNIVKPILSLFSKVTSEEQSLWLQVKKLKEEQSMLSMKDDFAVYSKLQRKINKIEAELKETSQSRAGKKLAVKSSLTLGLQGIIAITLIISIIWYRKEPIVILKGNLFPLSTFLRYPSEVENSVSAHIWVLVSNYSIRTLIKPLFAQP